MKPMTRKGRLIFPCLALGAGLAALAGAAALRRSGTPTPPASVSAAGPTSEMPRVAAPTSTESASPTVPAPPPSRPRPASSALAADAAYESTYLLFPPEDSSPPHTEEARRDLFARLAHPDERVRADAVPGLAGWLRENPGDRVREAWAGELAARDPSPEVRKRALWLQLASGDPAVFSAGLANLGRETSESALVYAIEKLALLADSRYAAIVRPGTAPSPDGPALRATRMNEARPLLERLGSDNSRPSAASAARRTLLRFH